MGKKGIGYFRYIGRALATQRIDIGDKPTADHASELVTPLIEEFAAGRLASLDIVYAKFNSPLSTPPTLLTVLPVQTPERPKGGVRPDYILKPGADEILEQLLPLYVRNLVYRGLVETAASEHGARRTAMKSATDNAGRDLRSAEAHLQPAAPGGDHPGNRGDSGRSGGAGRIDVEGDSRRSLRGGHKAQPEAANICGGNSLH